MPTLTQKFGGVSGTTFTLGFGADFGSPIVTAVSATMPTVKVDGGDPITATSAWWGGSAEFRHSSHVVFFLPFETDGDGNVIPTIPVGSAVTVSYGANLMTTGSGGNVALVDAALTNNTGGNVLPYEPPAEVDRTYRSGYMLAPEHYYGPSVVFANRVKGGSGWREDVTGGFLGVLYDGYDAGSFPNDPYAGRLGTPILHDSAGTPVGPTGHWTLLYTGSNDAAYLDINAAHTDTYDPALSDLTGPRKRKVYNITSTLGGIPSPNIWLSVDGTSIPNDIEIFDPLITDVDDPPEFHPAFLDKIAGIKLLRAKDWLDGDGGPGATTVDDYTPDAALFQGLHRGRLSDCVEVVSCEAYEGSNLPWNRDNNRFVKFTCSSPHGLSNGQQASLYSPVPAESGLFWVNVLVNGVGVDIPAEHPRMYVLSPTTFAFQVYGLSSPVDTQTFATPLKLWPYYCGWAVGPLVRLVNSQPDCDLWWSFARNCTAEGAASVGAYLAQHLTAGRRVYLEYGNETWNPGSSYYAGFEFCLKNGWEKSVTEGEENPVWTSNGGDGTQLQLLRARWYVMNSGALYEAFLSGWTGEGRDAADVKHVIADTWSGNLGNFLTNAADLYDSTGALTVAGGGTDPGVEPITVHCLAGALYTAYYPQGSTVSDEDYDACTVEQMMDVGDSWMLNYRASSDGVYGTAHMAAVAAAQTDRPGLTLVTYEGGHEIVAGAGDSTLQAARTLAWGLHPRSYGQTLAWHTFLNDCGVSTGIHSGVAGHPVSESGIAKAYTLFYSLDQTAGIGTGNVAEIVGPGGLSATPDLSVTDESPPGLAFAVWAGLAAAPGVGDPGTDPDPTPAGSFVALSIGAGYLLLGVS